MQRKLRPDDGFKRCKIEEHNGWLKFKKDGESCFLAVARDFPDYAGIEDAGGRYMTHDPMWERGRVLYVHYVAGGVRVRPAFVRFSKGA